MRWLIERIELSLVLFLLAKKNVVPYRTHSREEKKTHASVCLYRCDARIDSEKTIEERGEIRLICERRTTNVHSPKLAWSAALIFVVLSDLFRRMTSKKWIRLRESTSERWSVSSRAVSDDVTEFSAESQRRSLTFRSFDRVRSNIICFGRRRKHCSNLFRQLTLMARTILSALILILLPLVLISGKCLPRSDWSLLIVVDV